VQFVNKIAFLPLLLIMVPFLAYGQVPEEYYSESQLYPNQKSNDQLALSIDEYLYGPGGTVNVFGVVKNYQQGIQVLIKVYDPDKKQIVDLSSLAAGDGNFRTPFEIPQDAIDGNYTVIGKYGPNGKAVSLFFTIKNLDANIVRIPFGSNTEDEKFNFIPSKITVKFGAEITWINNDNGVHTVVSGKSGLNNVMYADGLFDSGPFGPQKNFNQSFFKEENYLYFCKLHPWLTGQITVSPYSGPPDAKPKPPEPELPSAQNMPNNYLFITTKRQTVGDNQRTLFDDNITSVFKTWRQFNYTSITISDVDDAKMGKNSLMIQVKAQNGATTTFYDYLKGNLQDWSHYNYLNFWFKGQNTNKIISISLLNETWKAFDRYDFVDDSSDWEKMQVPLYATYKNIDMSKIRGLEFAFQRTNGEFFIDGVVLSAKTNEPSLEINSGSYIFGETIQVSGIVPSNKPDAPVTIKVINPIQNIITVKQISPKLDNTFNFTLPILGHLFDKEGTYKISAQYGSAQYQNFTSFKLIVPQLVETYKGFEVYKVDDNFYSILQKQGGFDINRIRADQYSVILSGNSLDEIKENIAENTTELLPSFPVPNDVLLAIWNERGDLQIAFPEVNDGVLDNLWKWAKTSGWKEDPRLSILIPKGEMPDYLKSNKTLSETKLNEDLTNVWYLAGAMIVIAIGGIIGYKFHKGKKKS